MFKPGCLQSRRVAIYVLAFLSAGKEPNHTRIIDEPELSRHRTLKIAVDTGELRSSGELARHPDPKKQGEPHSFTLIHFDDLAKYAKTVSFDSTWLKNVLRLWKAVLAGAPQDELEEIFDACRTASDLQPKHLDAESRTKGGRAAKYDTGLQQFIDRLFAEFETKGDRLTPPLLKAWLVENAPKVEGYDPVPEIPDFGDLEFYDEKVWWKNRRGHPKSVIFKSLERYIKRAKDRPSDFAA